MLILTDQYLLLIHDHLLTKFLYIILHSEVRTELSYCQTEAWTLTKRNKEVREEKKLGIFYGIEKKKNVSLQHTVTN